jgi:hypothetical protein
MLDIFDEKIWRGTQHTHEILHNPAKKKRLFLLAAAVFSSLSSVHRV